MAKRKLTEKQKQFAQEYTKDFNGTQAAKRAGYSPDTAGAIASENLQKPEIIEVIDNRLEIINKKSLVEVEEIIRALCDIAFDEERYMPKDRLQALKMLGMYKGMFKQEIEIVKKTMHATIVAKLEALKSSK